TLNAGANTLRISPTWGAQFNINALSLTPVSVSNAPSTGTGTTPTSGNVTTLGSSATITADKYSDISNSRLEYIGGVPDIGYLSPNGGYVEYALNVQNAGNYTIAVNAASPNASSNFDLLVNGS